uniref:Uncharacterized protein n=1 Tax=Triticum urartu TaxID=4572 RepID=A0A8R7V011_TRIUA
GRVVYGTWLRGLFDKKCFGHIRKVYKFRNIVAASRNGRPKLC